MLQLAFEEYDSLHQYQKAVSDLLTFATSQWAILANNRDYHEVPSAEQVQQGVELLQGMAEANSMLSTILLRIIRTNPIYGHTPRHLWNEKAIVAGIGNLPSHPS